MDFVGTFKANFKKWKKLEQHCMSYDDLIKSIPENFSLDESEEIATCDHCKKQFDVNRGLSDLATHLQNKHAGEIIVG